jgi:hypothetical protein
MMKKKKRKIRGKRFKSLFLGCFETKITSNAQTYVENKVE